jgi:hypothetical protein
MTIPPLWRPFWLRHLSEGLSSGQVRIIRIRFAFLMIKMGTDFLVTAGTAFTAGALEAKGVPSVMVMLVAIIGGLVVAAKNLGDAIAHALPPPVISAPPGSAPPST